VTFRCRFSSGDVNLWDPALECCPSSSPLNGNENLMNCSFAKSNLLVLFVVTAVAGCLMTLDLKAVSAQSKSFQGSAYKNGQSNRTTPGVSQYRPTQEPSSTRSRFQVGGSESKTLLPSTATPSQSRQAGTAETSNSRGPWADVGSCSVEFVEVVDVPALEIGDLLEVTVREGDAVPMGKAIARINSKLQELELETIMKRQERSLVRAEDSITINAQIKQYDLAKNEYDTTRRLATKGARSASELLRAKFEKERSKLQIDAAKQQKTEARIEYEEVTAQLNQQRERLARHLIAVRFDGVVVELFKHAGEWVQAGEPIAKVARMDEMYVQGLIRYSEFNAHELLNKPVVVSVQLAQDEQMDFEGVVKVIPPNDAGSGEEYMIKALIKNRMVEGQWVLRKDARVSMKIKME